MVCLCYCQLQNIKIKSTVANLTMKLCMFLNTWVNMYMYTRFSYYKIMMEVVIKAYAELGGGGACLHSQHLGGRSLPSLKQAWSRRASSKIARIVTQSNLVSKNQKQRKKKNFCCLVLIAHSRRVLSACCAKRQRKRPLEEHFNSLFDRLFGIPMSHRVCWVFDTWI